MNAGKLDQRLTIFEPFEDKNADGQVVIRYDDRGTVWASIKHRPGSEAFQQARMEARDPATIAVRSSTLTRRITAEWRVETATSVYEIKGNPFLTEDRAFVVFQVEGKRK